MFGLFELILCFFCTVNVARESQRFNWDLTLFCKNIKISQKVLNPSKMTLKAYRR